MNDQNYIDNSGNELPIWENLDEDEDEGTGWYDDPETDEYNEEY